MHFTTGLSTLLLTATSVVALSPAGWRTQSVYQVLTDRFAKTDLSTTGTCNTGDGIYCGGTWQGIINNLDYIHAMGFTAIWITPFVENLQGNTPDGSAYHGYWAQDIYSVNANFGTSADLVALSAALHNKGMYLMADVVTNHMGYYGSPSSIDYTVFNPFNSELYYHPFCEIDYNNATSILVCWEGDETVPLVDMRTEDSNVLSMWETWITSMVSTYGIDGLRIDSAQQVDSAFFAPFQAAAGGMHVLGEVFNGNPTYVCPYQTFMTGLLNYPQYFWVTAAFESTSGSISNLVNGIGQMKSDCSDVTLLGSFLENHDNPRFPSITSDLSLAKNAIAFTILADGIPIIYEGQEQHYSGGAAPASREAIWLSGYSKTAALYTWIASLNQIRNEAIFRDSTYVTYNAYSTYSDSSTIVMRKGNTGSQIIGVFTNLGASGASYTLTLSSTETGFTASQSVIEVMSCTAYTTDSNGNLAVAMAGGLTRVFYPAAGLSGSGVCSSITGSSSSTLKTTTTSTTSNTKTTSTASKTSSTLTTKITTTTTACATATSVAVTFKETVTTTYGETVKISGSVAALGSWNSANAITLSAANYTSTDNQWFVSLNLPSGEVIEYKYINVGTSGTVTWESDPNHTYTVPNSCATAATISSTWQ